jgi:hypothetical protein
MDAKMINRSISMGMIILLACLAACVSEINQPPHPTQIADTPSLPISTQLPATPTLHPPLSETPSSTPRTDEFILAFFDTWNKAVESGEIVETLSYFAEDATLETIGYYHLVSTGRDSILTALEHWIGSGYVHIVSQYVVSGDGDTYYWSQDSDEAKEFCYGKVIIRDLEIIYLGYSRC